MATDNPTTLAQRIHDDIIDRYLADWPEAQRKGFFRALRSHPELEYTAAMLNEDPDWRAAVSFVPDAWMIVDEKRHVIIVEAVHRHDVSDEKFARMADLSWALDEDYYRLILIRCDRHNRVAYDVRGAYVCSELQHREHNIPTDGWTVPDWQRYDHEYVAAYFADAPK